MQTIRIENDSCPVCGDNPVARNLGTDGLIFDGDKVRCEGCGLDGYASVDEDHFMIHWIGEDA